MGKVEKVILCGNCPNKCSGCPEASLAHGKVVITDDNHVKTEGIRRIELTNRQFSRLLQEGEGSRLVKHDDACHTITHGGAYVLLTPDQFRQLMEEGGMLLASGVSVSVTGAEKAASA